MFFSLLLLGQIVLFSFQVGLFTALSVRSFLATFLFFCVITGGSYLFLWQHIATPESIKTEIKIAEQVPDHTYLKTQLTELKLTSEELEDRKNKMQKLWQLQPTAEAVLINLSLLTWDEDRSKSLEYLQQAESKNPHSRVIKELITLHASEK